MSEVRLPVPAFKWLLLALVSVYVLGLVPVGWFLYDVGRSVGKAEALVIYETSEMVRGQAAIVDGDSAVVDATLPVSP